MQKQPGIHIIICKLKFMKNIVIFIYFTLIIQFNYAQNVSLNSKLGAPILYADSVVSNNKTDESIKQFKNELSAEKAKKPGTEIL